VQEQLDVLKELQGIDQELADVRRQLARLEAESAELTTERDRVAAMVESLQGDLDKLLDEQRELERSLTVEQDNVDRAEGRLPAIKTQKEYVAVLKEIDTAKKLNKDLQDRIKAKAAEVETLTTEKSEKDGELATVTEQAAERCSALDAQARGITDSASQGEQRRDQLLERLPLPLRKRYQMLIERRNGIAIVAARKGACTGCNMQLPPQLYNSLFTSQEIQTCPHCNRLLFLGQD